MYKGYRVDYVRNFTGESRPELQGVHFIGWGDGPELPHLLHLMPLHGAWHTAQSSELIPSPRLADIDDKIIKRAAETGEDWQSLTQRFIDEFHTDMVGGYGSTGPG